VSWGQNPVYLWLLGVPEFKTLSWGMVYITLLKLSNYDVIMVIIILYQSTTGQLNCGFQIDRDAWYDII